MLYCYKLQSFTGFHKSQMTFLASLIPDGEQYDNTVLCLLWYYKAVVTDAWYIVQEQFRDGSFYLYTVDTAVECHWPGRAGRGHF